MRPAEQLFIAVMVVLGIVFIGFLLASLPKIENIEITSPSTLASFITKTIVIPSANAAEEPIIPLSLKESRGGFGWSSAPAREREDAAEETDDEEEETEEEQEENEEEIPPCPDADADLICDDNELPEEQPTTLQVPPANFKVAFIGDSGYGSNYRQVLELIRAEETDMVIHAGDLGYDGAPQVWLEVIESVLDPTVPNTVFPYFFSMGNHDVEHWNEDNGYREILEQRFARLGITYTGNPSFLGAQTSFIYNGIAVVLAAPGEDEDVAGENHWLFIEQQLENNAALWDICAWHKNMRAMQVGGKRDETGWEVYEACREQGAIIATGHEHSYGRTHVLSDMVNQEIIDGTSPYTIEPGQTFAFHSGLGGQSVRNQRSDINNLNYFATVYTFNQATNRDTAYGALFIEFNVENDPRKAKAYFKNIGGEVIDQFEIYNNTPEREAEEEEPIIPPAGFVYAESTELRVDGEPYQFIGFNVYGLANDENIFACGPSVNHGENPDEYLQALFSNLSSTGVNAIRFWAFQNFTDSGTDFSSFDRVIEYATQYNVKLIPTLENHWDGCTEPEDDEKSTEWYASGYTQPYGNYALSYPDYVRTIVSRYQNEPAILMWQLMNEAESQDADALYDFTVEMSELVKSIDRNHLVSLGTIGRGQAGTQNENFVRLHNIDTIDVVEAHDYSHQDEAWPSSGSNSINRAFEVAQVLNKPFFIGESGISVDSDTTREDRAALFEAKISEAFTRGVVGYLIWKWEDGCTSNYCVTEGDVVLDVIERYQ